MIPITMNLLFPQHVMNLVLMERGEGFRLRLLWPDKVYKRNNHPLASVAIKERQEKNVKKGRITASGEGRLNRNDECIVPPWVCFFLFYAFV